MVDRKIGRCVRAHDSIDLAAKTFASVANVDVGRVSAGIVWMTEMTLTMVVLDATAAAAAVTSTMTVVIHSMLHLSAIRPDSL